MLSRRRSEFLIPKIVIPEFFFSFEKICSRNNIVRIKNLHFRKYYFWNTAEKTKKGDKLAVTEKTPPVARVCRDGLFGVK